MTTVQNQQEAFLENPSNFRINNLILDASSDES